MTNRVVLCMKWGTLYGPDYVNVLFNACRANITGNFTFVCLTDDAAGLNPDITAHPIPDIGCPPAHWKGGAWPKLSVFVPDLYGLTGRALFIDLDTIICQSLDPFFEQDAPLLAVGGGKYWTDPANNAPTANTTIFAFDLGAQTQIIDAYQADPNAASERFTIEQRFVEHHATAWQPWATGWVLSFKRHLRRPILIDRLLPPKTPGPEVRLVAFHGLPRPKSLATPDGNWSEFPHHGRGAVPWVQDYWTRFD